MMPTGANDAPLRLVKPREKPQVACSRFLPNPDGGLLEAVLWPFLVKKPLHLSNGS
jgi:hypothetical protein